MVFATRFSFYLFLEQFTASLAKTVRGNFYNFHEVVSQIYPE